MSCSSLLVCTDFFYNADCLFEQLHGNVERREQPDLVFCFDNENAFLYAGVYDRGGVSFGLYANHQPESGYFFYTRCTAEL